jgi:hypothetical protein
MMNMNKMMKRGKLQVTKYNKNWNLSEDDIDEDDMEDDEDYE